LPSASDVAIHVDDLSVTYKTSLERAPTLRGMLVLWILARLLPPFSG